MGLEMWLHLCGWNFHFVGDFIDRVSNVAVRLLFFFLWAFLIVSVFLVQKLEVFLLSLGIHALLSINQKELCVVFHWITWCHGLYLLEIVEVSSEVWWLFSSLFEHCLQMRSVVDLISSFTLQKWFQLFFYFLHKGLASALFWFRNRMRVWAWSGSDIFSISG